MTVPLKLKPEDNETEKPNAFRDIRELPWWQVWLETAGYVAAALVILEAVIRLLFLLFSG